MSHPAADEARALSDHELAQAVNEAYRELFNLQFQKGTRQLQDPTTIRRARRQTARLRTIQRERQIAAVAGAPIAPLAEPPAAVLSPQKRRAQEERAARERPPEAATDEAATDEAATDEAAAEPVAPEAADEADDDMAPEAAPAAVAGEDVDEPKDKPAPADESGPDDEPSNEAAAEQERRE